MEGCNGTIARLAKNDIICDMGILNSMNKFCLELIAVPDDGRNSYKKVIKTFSIK